MSSWWKNLRIKLKFQIGILFLLIVTLAGIALFITTLRSLAGNTEMMSRAAQLNIEISELEAQHLQWVNELAVYLAAQAPGKLGVQKDHTLCGFGKFLHGADRTETEKIFPSSVRVLAAIEEPHRLLHATAQDIENAALASD